MDDQAKTVGILQRAVQLVGGSLPMYLVNADLWTNYGQEHAADVLDMIVQDQRRSIDRLNDMITRLGGVIEHPRFPARYTALNDVALDFMLQRLPREQTDLMERLEALAAELPEQSQARDLVEEIAGATRGHAQSLEELAGELTNSL